MDTTGMRNRGQKKNGIDDPTELAGGDAEGSDVAHRNILFRLRSTSRQDLDCFGMIMGESGVPEQTPKVHGSRSPLRKNFVSEEPSTWWQKIFSVGQNFHDGLEDWGYRNFPVITDQFNLLVYLVDLAIRSVKWFQFGAVAVFLGFRLVLYAILIMPPCIRILLQYYHDSRIQRRIRFGPAEREYLDIYIPKEALAAQRGEGKPVPVVIAIMGGAFIIGHRGYNAQLAMRLMDFGVVTVGIDYRNFPRARIPDMVEDVARGVRWVFQNISVYGGDRHNMVLLGQSAGAHLSAMLLMEHALMEVMYKSKEVPDNSPDLPVGIGHRNSPDDCDTWSVSHLKGYVAISGLYELEKMGPHLASRGLYPRILDHLTHGDLKGCSPECLLGREEWTYHQEELASMLPPIHLFHGYKDKAVPIWSTTDFAEKLKSVGIRPTLDLRRDMTHTYPVVEGPMRRHDPQVEIVLPMLFGEGAEKRIRDEPKPPGGLWPVPVLNVAGFISPF